MTRSQPSAQSWLLQFAVPRSEAIWLLYLLFLVFQPLFDPNSTARDWWLIGAMALAFVPVYGWTQRVISNRPYLWRGGVAGGVLGVLAMVVMGVLLVPTNSGATTFLIYAAAAAGKVRPRKRALALLGVVGVAIVAAFFTSTVPMPYTWAAFVPAFVFAPLVGLGTIYEVERGAVNAKLRMAQEEVEQLATIAERERIARDLHDLLGHTLSTITLKSELAARLVARDPDRAELEMRDVERLSRETLSEVRSAVSGYRSSGLAGELANAKLALEAAGIEFDYFTAPLPLKPAVEGVLASALREAVTNVVRHAQAKRCQVTLEDDGAYVLLRVEDDGVGAASGNHDATSSGIGLSAMQERVRALGGQVTLTPTRSAALSGMRLEVAVPRQAALKLGADDSVLVTSRLAPT